MDIPIQPVTINIAIGIALIGLGLLLILYIFPEIVKIYRVWFKIPKLPFAKKQITKVVLVIIGLCCIGLGIYLLCPTCGDTPSCIYNSKTQSDAEAIAWLIEHEPQAVVSEDMNLIKGIFADEAKIVDYFNRSSPIIWSNPIDRYQPLFKDYQFIDAQNTNIKATGPISSNTVKYISGSHGAYTFKGQTYTFQNPDDANHWTVTKINGCWKITRFDFNASGIIFP